MKPLTWPVVAFLLRRAMPPRHLAPTLGDLLEEYGQYRQRHGRWRAEWWCLREAASVWIAYRWPVRRDGVSSRSPIDALGSDLHQTWRAIRARPGATLATSLVLTIGIALVSSMFALADPYILRPLPYTRPNDLAVLSLSARSMTGLPTLEDWNDHRELFDGVAAAERGGRVQVNTGDRDAAVRLAQVSQNFFDVLGVRVPLPAEWRTTASRSETPLVLTPAGSRALFSTTQTIGRFVRKAEEQTGFRVVAVLPESFLDPLSRPGSTSDGFVPLDDTRLLRIRAVGSGVVSDGPSVIARLRPGVTTVDVQSRLSTAVPRAAGSPFLSDGLIVRGVLLTSMLTDRVRPLAAGAFGAGVLVLLVCAANVANLLLARGASRTRELAAREALGASRWDVARLVLAELAAVTMLGVAGGLASAHGVLALVSLVIPAQYVSLGAPAITLRVAGIAIAAGVVVMVAGLVPAWAAWRVAPRALFGEMRGTDTRRARVLRFVMTSTQTAVAVVLVVAASLFGRSYAGMMLQDPGYDGETFAVTAIYAGRGSAASPLRDSIDDTLRRIHRVPGVSNVAVAASPFVNASLQVLSISKPLTINGREVPGNLEPVSREFFDATGARLTMGRWPASSDAMPSLVVSESFARMCCNAESPLGLMLSTGDRALPIVGVVKDVYARTFDEAPKPTVFVPLDAGDPIGGVINYLVRTSTPTVDLATAIEREIRAVVPTASVSDSATLRSRLMQSVSDRSFSTLMVMFFAVAAMGVTAAGIVGVVAFVVARRTREVAIRIAIGANAASVRALVTREALAATAVGALIGFGLSLALSTTVRSLLVGIAPTDPLALGTAVVVIVAIVGVAAWIPARRATRLSPTVALRVE